MLGQQDGPEYYEFSCAGRHVRLDQRWLTIGFLTVATILVLVFLGLLIAELAGPGATLREYYIAIDEVEWDYAPDGRDTCHDDVFSYTEVSIHLLSPQIECSLRGGS